MSEKEGSWLEWKGRLPNEKKMTLESKSKQSSTPVEKSDNDTEFHFESQKPLSIISYKN
jgi:hypothetical protein